MFYPSSSVKIENLFRITAYFHKEGSFQQDIFLVYAYLLYMQYKNVFKSQRQTFSASDSGAKLPFSDVAQRLSLSCLKLFYSLI